MIEQLRKLLDERFLVASRRAKPGFGRVRSLQQ